ncbi:similar to Saccharomyces cerevisiae YLL035W GRC3 Polynucleotide kinase present on rDNA that is required for efficient transcription termination by RNA polymerase I [Maudiozyma barnettii]|uniref:Polynucleotide 5'-hydroxyl-kinase GRC3 n=1 Tax=Maudiozyma barnettii TaxID=61262 RepID=A0A8H2VHK7_9SACH|nr:polynucleotide 5'-hydroxyl-kinase [Kazachstania barnettii]CAB4255576.1 similar to Saccharomyces cerevisiae YLL035W GRC3 Polynucleotide kinase present on rDNA that is required for efficient transcription termination by RNA polymerase I [Kazachstania barnettii]CAD1784074.1 similar to Saccharomyces cerevisiae YLL035W GRC3 Polynucleotide kinase present on rDNA that is required for efficient transcription termination by RNA polymerase I [Kazachstania barnettii]
MSNNGELVYLSSDGEDSDSVLLDASKTIERKPTCITDDYDGDSSELEDDEASTSKGFTPTSGNNVLRIKERDLVFTLIGLKEKQGVHISGVFDIQIIKGGIMYNGVHYNASKNRISFSHPLTDAIPEIKSSFHAGWDEPLFLTAKQKKLIDIQMLENFVCVLKVSSANVDGLLGISSLYPDASSLWKPKYSPSCIIPSSTDTFCILDKTYEDEYTSQSNPTSWQDVIDNLFVAFKNQEYDMRVMVIGGKNSGKSTFLRSLLETFMNKTILNEDGSTFKSQEDILYMDLDPGQPEYSDPECISLTEISPTHVAHLGQRLAQHSHKKLQQFYYGSSSPQDEPTLYMEQINEMMKYFEERESMGTTLLNLPGWIKGFGMTIVNNVIRLFKPTHVICIDSSKLDAELEIQNEFANAFQIKYEPKIYNVDSIFSHSTSQQNLQPRFHAPQIRTIKMLMSFHRLRSLNNMNLKYDFAPLLSQKPIQISYGALSGIEGIQFYEEYSDLEENDIKGALEGMVVGLGLRRTWNNEGDAKPYRTIVDTYPIVKNRLKASNVLHYSLALIHSVDLENQIINIFLPDINKEKVKAKTEELRNSDNENDEEWRYSWVIIRGKSDTPLCELYPKELSAMFDKYETIPYISTSRRKKYEHVWKVRKNVQRRGQTMK